MLDSILAALGLRADRSGGGGEVPETVNEIVRQLERLPPERARYVADFALVLSRAADADMEIGAEEQERIAEILEERGGLSTDEARTVAGIAAVRSRTEGGTEHFLATRDFAERSTREQREDLIDCLFSVAAADGSISTTEENRVRQIASELGFTHEEFAAARSRWNEVREILK